MAPTILVVVGEAVLVLLARGGVDPVLGREPDPQQVCVITRVVLLLDQQYLLQIHLVGTGLPEQSVLVVVDDPVT